MYRRGGIHDNDFVTQRTHRRRVRGQAAVETAIVMPLFVFLILGMLQLGLMHQARILAKYAAYKAVRVGSIHNAKQSAMKYAALGVLLPMAGTRATVYDSKGTTNSSTFYKAMPGDYATSWNRARTENDSNTPDRQIVDVTICDPLTTTNDDFDDPDGELGPHGGDWQGFNNGRLSIQVTFYYELVIPFVNGVLWHIVAGSEKAELMRTLRLAPKDDSKFRSWASSRGSRTVSSFSNLANRHIYVLPIRASWSMRMMSNYLQSKGGDFKLPSKNKCRIGWRPPGYSP